MFSHISIQSWSPTTTAALILGIAGLFNMKFSPSTISFTLGAFLLHSTTVSAVACAPKQSVYLYTNSLPFSRHFFSNASSPQLPPRSLSHRDPHRCLIRSSFLLHLHHNNQHSNNWLPRSRHLRLRHLPIALQLRLHVQADANDYHDANDARDAYLHTCRGSQQPNQDWSRLRPFV